MSVHDHHNDPNDPVNHPQKRSKSTLPVDLGANRNEGNRNEGNRNEGMGGGAWMLGLLALVLIGSAIYAMSDRTTTASNTASPPASTSATPRTIPSTTGSGTNPASNPATTTGTASPSSNPAAPSPTR